MNRDEFVVGVVLVRVTISRCAGVHLVLYRFAAAPGENADLGYRKKQKCLILRYLIFIYTHN